MNTDKNIIFVSRQAGTANAFIPVIKYLINKNYHLTVFAYPQSSEQFKVHNIKHYEINCFKDAIPNLSLLKHATTLISGTSDDVEDDSKFWIWGAKQKVVTAAFVDQWMKYESRFMVDKRSIYPDKLLVIDEYTKSIYKSIGVDDEKIIISGHPSFNCNNPIPKGFENNNKNILFVSEPYSLGNPQSLWGELDALTLLLNGVEHSSEDYNIIIRPHPRECDTKFLKHLNNNHSDSKTRVTVSRDSQKDEDLSKCFAVIGLKSIMVFEAFLKGKMCACILPSEAVGNDFLNIVPNIPVLSILEETITFLSKGRDHKGNNIPPEYLISSIDRFENFIESI